MNPQNFIVTLTVARAMLDERKAQWSGLNKGGNNIYTVHLGADSKGDLYKLVKNGNIYVLYKSIYTDLTSEEPVWFKERRIDFNSPEYTYYQGDDRDKFDWMIRIIPIPRKRMLEFMKNDCKVNRRIPCGSYNGRWNWEYYLSKQPNGGLDLEIEQSKLESVPGGRTYIVRLI